MIEFAAMNSAQRDEPNSRSRFKFGSLYTRTASRESGDVRLAALSQLRIIGNLLIAFEA